MASLLNSESRRLYSWWWDSHISPKNSKWLQENLTDMDAKVKAMIKLIEEDADSFARRAEMYYKKRPELMKLVEEFYRAYRALAERYDHATGELRQAHRTMTEAFPNQVPFVLTDDSPSGSANGMEPQTPEMPRSIRALFDPDDLHKDASGFSVSELRSVKSGSHFGDSDAVINKRGLKQLYEMFGSAAVVQDNIKFANGTGRKEGRYHDIEEKEGTLRNDSQLSDENQSLKIKVLSEGDRAGKAESEVQNLKKLLADVQAQKETVVSQHQQSLEKLSSLEEELTCAENDSMRLKEQASKAESNIFLLKEAIAKLEAERDTCFNENKNHLERICNLEVKVSHTQEDAKGLDERTIKAEIEAQYLKNELSKFEAEKEVGLLQYKQCLEKISKLEKKVFLAEEDAKGLTQQAERAETEVEKLKTTLAEVSALKEATSLQHSLCLEKISKLESKISSAQEDIRCLNNDILVGATKLSTAEGKCDLLEMSNQTLRLETDNLVKKIASKDKELSEKHEELAKLQICLQDERVRYGQVETSLNTLQNLYSQSQEEQQSLALELENVLQILKDMDICKHDLEEEMQQIKDENQSLNELNFSSTKCMKDLQNEISGLKRLKERLEEEVTSQLGQSNSLQQEIFCLKQEISGLNTSYEELIKQLELVGLSPESVGTCVKELQDENSKLRQIYKNHRDEKETLLKKLYNMEELSEKNASLESLLCDVNGRLESSQERANKMEESSNILQAEKSAVVAEKAILLSQLQIITENMQKLLEKNAFLENSLSSATAEVVGLREKLKSLEDLCQLLGNEKANLIAERNALAAQLEAVEQRLDNMEKKFAEFEEKYAGMAREKEYTLSQLEDLRVSFWVEKQERASFSQRRESQLASLENNIHLLQEECRCWKKEFQQELDKAVSSQFEIFMLQKFIEDMEEKNYMLLAELQKHINASKSAEKLITELENENLDQELERELLVGEIDKLRFGIYQVFKALEDGPDNSSKEKIENDQIFVHHILDDVADMKHCLSQYNEDKQQLVVENSVLLTLLGELRLEGLEVVSQKNNLDQAFKTMTEKLFVVQSEKQELLQMNRQLRAELSMENNHTELLIAEAESLSVKQACIERAYIELQEEYSQILEENKSLLKKNSDLKEEKSIVEEENNTILLEMLTSDCLCAIFNGLRTENTEQVKVLTEDLNDLHGANNELAKAISTLREKLDLNETAKLQMEYLVEKLEMELSGVNDQNYKLKQEISSVEGLRSHSEKQLSDAEQKLVITENLNSELCRSVEELKRVSEETGIRRENLEVQNLQLYENNRNQHEEIQSLLEMKEKLESDLGMLNEQIVERTIREDNLNSELQETQKEFELWDAEASTFYFDLQVSAIREVLVEDKVHELTGVCDTLQDEIVSKTRVIEQMKERLGSKDSELGDLKAQLLAYAPAIASLGDNIECLEHSIFSRATVVVADNEAPKDLVVDSHTHDKILQEGAEDQLSPILDGILDLQRLQNRIKAVEKAVVEQMNKLESYETSNTKLKDAIGEIAILKSEGAAVQGKGKQELEASPWDETVDNFKSQKTKSELPEVKNGTLMKDIPLDQVSDCSLYGGSGRGSSRADDQMLVLWETEDTDRTSIGQHLFDEGIVYGRPKDAKQRSSHPSSELEMEKELGVDQLQVSTSKSKPDCGGNHKKILERLGSDGQKLATIQMTVQDLRKKLETNKKSRKAKNVDLETVEEQLQEVEETTVQLFNLNGQLSRKIEEILFYSDGKSSTELEEAVSVQKKRVSEQARKGSEKIGRLQLEVQKIQYIIQKLENEKKSKGINQISRAKSRTVIMRDFILHRGKRSSERRKKGRFCGCFKPSTGEANI